MSLFGWFDEPHSHAKSQAIIRRVVSLLPYPTMEIEPGLVSATAERRDTYRVSLFLMAKDEQISLMAASEISVERDLIPRELALILLEENQRYEHGSFRLVAHDEQRQVVLGRTVDTRYFPEAKMKQLGESMIDRMQLVVQKLYAMGLIISGPEHVGKQKGRG